jgi:hypothetical protein
LPWLNHFKQNNTQSERDEQIEDWVMLFVSQSGRDERNQIVEIGDCKTEHRVKGMNKLNGKMRFYAIVYLITDTLISSTL